MSLASERIARKPARNGREPARAPESGLEGWKPIPSGMGGLTHDVHIVFTEIRPGERLNEILFAREEPSVEIGVAGIVAARPVCPALDSMRGWLVALRQALEREDRAVIYRVLRDAVPDFRGEAA